MNAFTPTLNLNALKRKQKGITKQFGGIVVPYYTLKTEGQEGAPVKIDTTQVDTIVLLPAGEGDKCFGFLTQNVIDDANFGQLQGYHFANDTRARPGEPVGVLTGQGYCSTINYKGVVSKGGRVYFDPADYKLTATVIADNELNAIFDEDADAAANDSLYDTTAYQKSVRIRFNFDLTV